MMSLISSCEAAWGLAKYMPITLPSSWTSLAETGFDWIRVSTCLPGWLTCPLIREPLAFAALASLAKASNLGPSKGASGGMMGFPCEGSQPLAIRSG